MGKMRPWIAAALACGLAACGDSLLEQGLLGAGAGAAGAVVLDGDAATGAVAGAVANIAYCQRFPTRC